MISMINQKGEVTPYEVVSEVLHRPNDRQALSIVGVVVAFCRVTTGLASITYGYPKYSNRSYFTLLTDHAALKWKMTTSRLTGK